MHSKNVLKSRLETASSCREHSTSSCTANNLNPIDIKLMVAKRDPGSLLKVSERRRKAKTYTLQHSYVGT
jgi:hypothetical protein